LLDGRLVAEARDELMRALRTCRGGTFYALRSHGIESLDDLMAYDDHRLLGIKGIGPRTVVQIRRAIRDAARARRLHDPSTRSARIEAS
jgi:hypothetical protein